MKKNTLILLTLVPVVTGYILNLTLLIPGLGLLLYYLIPCVTLFFWFYLGSKYSKIGWNIIQATIIGNGIGLISLIAYFWQFWGCHDDNRNMLIAGVSQYFVANTNLLTAKFAIIFESQANSISLISVTSMQLFGLFLMVIIFLSGYVFGKVRGKTKPSLRDSDYKL